MEKATQQEMYEYLLEVKGAYNLKNRSVLFNEKGEALKCLYYKEGTDGCAVGRRIQDKELCKKLDSFEAEGNGYPKSGFSVQSTKVRELLPDAVLKFGYVFLREMQELHDVEKHWNESGLSPEGIEKVKLIEHHIGENYYYH